MTNKSLYFVTGSIADDRNYYAIKTSSRRLLSIAIQRQY
jgi:hypothetical protein